MLQDFAPLIRHFNTTLDSDGNGFLDVEELSAWVEPEGFVQAKSEVVYLMETRDKDGDKMLSKDEVLKEVKSQGLLYRRIRKVWWHFFQNSGIK